MYEWKNVYASDGEDPEGDIGSGKVLLELDYLWIVLFIK